MVPPPAWYSRCQGWVQKKLSRRPHASTSVMTQSFSKKSTSNPCLLPQHLPSQQPAIVSTIMGPPPNPAKDADYSKQNTNTLDATSKLNRPNSDSPQAKITTTTTSVKANGTPQPAASAPITTTTTPADTPAVPTQVNTNAPSDSTPKLSGAELKKRAKAEKAARRAKEKEEREQASGSGTAASGGGSASGNAKQQLNQPLSKKGPPGPQAQKIAETGGSGGKGQKQFGTGGGGGGGGGAATAGRRASVSYLNTTELSRKKKWEEENMAVSKTVAMFSHLSLQNHRGTIAGAGKEIHPAILALGLQMRDYVICGSSARCVAMLLAFKRVRYAPLCLSQLRFLLQARTREYFYQDIANSQFWS